MVRAGDKESDMAEPAKKYVTFAEYLALEEVSETKHEWLDGEVFAMSGGTVEHALYSSRVLGMLVMQLQGRPCEAINSDVRNRVKATGLATYPDITVVCGRIETDPEDKNSITNPIVLVEVLSPSTEAYDRGKKFGHYKRMPSLREYVLVSQDERLVEVFRRGENDEWTHFDSQDKDSIELASIRCTLTLDKIYRGPLDGDQAA